MKYMRGEDYPTDMSELTKLLDKAGISYEKRVHPVTAAEPVKHVIGYNPAGEWQIIITTRDALYSVVRGMVSFGDYEIMRVTGVGKFGDPERFSTPQQLVKELL